MWVWVSDQCQIPTYIHILKFSERPAPYFCLDISGCGCGNECRYECGVVGVSLSPPPPSPFKTGSLCWNMLSSWNFVSIFGLSSHAHKKIFNRISHYLLECIWLILRSSRIPNGIRSTQLKVFIFLFLILKTALRTNDSRSFFLFLSFFSL